MTVHLVVVFNHPHGKNIPLLESFLKEKFSSITYLLPLEATDRPDTITYYRGSYCFHGAIVDAFGFLSKKETDWFVFMQDDVLLRPDIDEHNILDFLNVDDCDAFFPAYRKLSQASDRWSWTVRILWKWLHPRNTLSGSGMKSVGDFLPITNDISMRLEKHGIPPCTDIPCIGPDSTALKNATAFNPPNSRSHHIVQEVAAGLFEESRSIKIDHPLLYGVSDFFAVRKRALKNLVNAFGILAAADIFAEVSIPTALVRCCDRISVGDKNGIQCRWAMGADRGDVFDAKSIRNEFIDNPSLLLIHPMKWSRLVRNKELRDEWISEMLP